MPAFTFRTAFRRRVAADMPPTLGELMVRMFWLSIGPALLISAIALVYDYQRQRAEVEAQTVVRAGAILDDAMRFTQGEQDRLSRLAADIQSAAADPARTEAALRRHAGVGTQVQLAFVDASRPSVVSQLPADALDGLPWSTTSMSPFGPVLVSADGAGAHVAMGIPVVSGTRLAGGVVSRIATEAFRDLIAAHALPSGWTGLIVDANGRVVARVPGHETYAGSQVGPSLSTALDPAAGAGGRVVSRVALDGTRVVSGLVKAPAIGWTAVVSVPSSVLEASIRRTAGYLAGAFAVIFVTGALGASGLHHRITRAMDMVRKAAAATEHGSVPPPAAPSGVAEADLLMETLRSAATSRHEANAWAVRSQQETERLAQNFHEALMAEADARQAQLANELHDAVGSSLAGIVLVLGRARAMEQDPAIMPLLESCQEELSRAADRVRRIARGAMPAGTDDGLLAEALEDFARDLRRSGVVNCTVQARGDFSDVSAATGTHLYRITQEAVANAIRHGKATRVRLRLFRCGRNFRLSILDDGGGFDPAAPSGPQPGLGLRSIHARAREIGGTVRLLSRSGSGCTLRISWPSRPREMGQRPGPEHRSSASRLLDPTQFDPA